MPWFNKTAPEFWPRRALSSRPEPLSFFWCALCSPPWGGALSSLIFLKWIHCQKGIEVLKAYLNDPFLNLIVGVGRVGWFYDTTFRRGDTRLDFKKSSHFTLWIVLNTQKRGPARRSYSSPCRSFSASSMLRLYLRCSFARADILFIICRCFICGILINQ